MKPVPGGFARYKAIQQAADEGSWDLRKCVRDDGQLKNAWRTQEAADKAAERVRRAPGFTSKPGEELTSYAYPVCGFWHVGNTPTTRDGQ